jgi:hypothetical protein
LHANNNLLYSYNTKKWQSAVRDNNEKARERKKQKNIVQYLANFFANRKTLNCNSKLYRYRVRSGNTLREYLVAKTVELSRNGKNANLP